MIHGVGFIHMVPTSTGKMGEHFSVREKSGNFEHTEKVWEFFTKYWQSQGILDNY